MDVLRERYRPRCAGATCGCSSAGWLISATGSWAYNVALLAYVFNHTHSLGWVGAAGLARFVPRCCSAPTRASWPSASSACA